MDLGISGKRAAVAAGTAGLGYACAEALAAEGVQVTICAPAAGRAEAAAQRLGGRTGWTVAHLTVPAEAARFVADAGTAMGGLAIRVVTGPGAAPGTVRQPPAQAYQEALNRSLLAVVEMCTAAVPAMRDQGWGRIVAITSLGVRQPYPNLALSNTARAGATGFLRTLAREVAPDGVTVNSVQPGLHATERVRQVYGDGDSAALAGALSTVPAGGLRDPGGLGALVAFLCAEPPSSRPGAATPVDGGASQSLL